MAGRSLSVQLVRSHVSSNGAGSFYELWSAILPVQAKRNANNLANPPERIKFQLQHSHSSRYLSGSYPYHGHPLLQGKYTDHGDGDDDDDDDDEHNDQGNTSPARSGLHLDLWHARNHHAWKRICQILTNITCRPAFYSGGQGIVGLRGHRRER